MSWAKLDDHFFAHKKVIDLSKDAKLLFLSGLTHCAAQLTDGEISAGGLRAIAALVDVSRSFAAELVEAELWEQEGTTYYVHDYHKYNPSATTVKQRRENDAKRQENWRDNHRDDASNKEESNGVSHAQYNGVSNGATNTRPVPVPVPVPNPLPDPVPQAYKEEGTLTEHPAAGASEPSPDKSNQPDYSPQFEGEFWQPYPKRDGTKKGSKADAWALFKKLTVAQRNTACEMVHVYARLDAVKAENGRFIPDADRWLREKRWETVEEEYQAEQLQRLNGGTNGNGHSAVRGRQFGTAKHNQSEASVREEMEWRARRHNSGLDLESTLGSQ